MKTLSRYFFTQAIKVFVLAAVSFLGLSLLFEFFDVMKSAGKSGASLWTVLRYLAYSAPRYAVFSIPLATLLSTVVVLSMAARKRELVAIRSIGASLRRAGFIFVILGLFWSVATFLISEHVAPNATRKAQRIKTLEIQKKESRITYVREKIWVRIEGGGLARINALSGTRLKGVSLFRMQDGIRERIEAKQGQWDGQSWSLINARVYTFSKDGMTQKTEASVSGAGLPPPDTLKEEQRQPDEMTYAELDRYATDLESAGVRVESYRVTLYSKFSFPLVCLAMALLGAALTARDVRGGGRAMAIVICTVLSVAYWAMHMLMLSLGYVGRVPPLAAAWITPLAFLLAGGYLYGRMES